MLRITSPNFYVGRLRPVRVIVLHTAQAPCLPGRADPDRAMCDAPATRGCT